MPRSVFDAVSGLLPPAPGRLASRAAATVHALADIRRAPDMLATSAGEFNLDVLAGDNALAPYKADNAATDATSVGHVGERRNFTATSHAGSSARRQPLGDFRILVVLVSVVTVRPNRAHSARHDVELHVEVTNRAASSYLNGRMAGSLHRDRRSTRERQIRKRRQRLLSKYLRAALEGWR